MMQAFHRQTEVNLFIPYYIVLCGMLGILSAEGSETEEAFRLTFPGNN